MPEVPRNVNNTLETWDPSSWQCSFSGGTRHVPRHVPQVLLTLYVSLREGAGGPGSFMYKLVACGSRRSLGYIWAYGKFEELATREWVLDMCSLRAGNAEKQHSPDDSNETNDCHENYG